MVPVFIGRAPEKLYRGATTRLPGGRSVFSGDRHALARAIAAKRQVAVLLVEERLGALVVVGGQIEHGEERPIVAARVVQAAVNQRRGRRA